MRRIRVIDSHTEGEPTRVVVEGIPDLGEGSAAERRLRFRERFDDFRSAVISEPRGFDAMVGALLLAPSSPNAAAQAVFFNNVGVLLGCIHGTIGVVATLRHLGRVGSGSFIIETPVGEVRATIADDGLISVENVESYRFAHGVEVDTSDHGTIIGDVAYGGNWFFLVNRSDREIVPDAIAGLTELASDILESLARQGITGADGAEIDHVELFGSPSSADADSRNFVLCPGREYDRSPCGTGTSAKMACLSADGLLREGDVWRQESIIGSMFLGSITRTERGVVPTVSGRAWITSEATLILDPSDPFESGIRL